MKCEIARPNKPYLGAQIRKIEGGHQGMMIVMIKSDSPAEKAKLRVKDIILEINGMKIHDHHDYFAAIGSIADKKRMKILRREKEKEEIIEINVEYIYNEPQENI
jgi:S1-C subfamily serine protease